MTRLLSLFAILSSFVSSVASAQVEVRNGGDVIFCKDDGAIEFNGWYFLDYVATWDAVAGREALHDAADPVESIIQILTDRIPGLGMNLREFVDEARRQLASGSDPTSRFIWMRTSNGIVALHDEQLSSLPGSFPENCFEIQPGQPKMLNLHQVVLHSNRGEASIFKYDSNFAAHISNQPLQMSMLLVHEWLWRFSPNATVTRDVNRYLHTRSIMNTSGPSLKRALTNLGLDLSTIPAPRVELRLDRNDIESIQPRSFPFDPDYGVELHLLNDLDGYFRVTINNDDDVTLNMIFMRPRSLGAPTEVTIKLEHGATVYVESCEATTQRCNGRHRLLDFHIIP